MRVLVIGGGGREHALCRALANSPSCEALLCAPGNAGVAEIAEVHPLSIEDPAAVVAFARAHAVDFVVVGPEAPLVAGVVDALEAAGVAAFGPTAAAARLEASKAFAKDVCAEAGAPTAADARFTDAAAAKAHARAMVKAAPGAPVVVKADGLAAGKGVVIAETLAEADAAIDAMLSGAFGAAGETVVLEEFLVGEEASFFAICDGIRALALATAQDHKRVHDGDRGPNTGGMGAYSPAPVMTPARCDEAMTAIVLPTLRVMAARGTPFRGLLYAGLMATDAGLKLIEFNVRFGDPEAQAVLARLDGDLLAAMKAARDGDLSGVALNWRAEPALSVVMAARGYPGAYDKGSVIRGVDAANAVPGVHVVHAGTARDADGRLIAAGGRVLGVTARGATLAEAQARAYQGVDRIDWPQGFCRRDIGWRALDAGRGDAG